MSHLVGIVYQPWLCHIVFTIVQAFYSPYITCRNRTKLNQIKQSITKQMTFNAFSTKANKRECKQFVCVLLCFVQVVQK